MLAKHFTTVRARHLPPSLAGYGPGRPEYFPIVHYRNITAAAVAVGYVGSNKPHSPHPITKLAKVQQPAVEKSFVPSYAPVVSTQGVPFPTFPASELPRQKMPLGSGRRISEFPLGGPSGLSFDTRSSSAAGQGPHCMSATSTPFVSNPPFTSEVEHLESSAANERYRNSSNIINDVLARPNPPPPRELLNLLCWRPYLVSRESGAALISYAERMSDLKTKEGAIRLLARERIESPSELDSRPRIAKRKLREPGWIRPNISLLYRYPPVKVLPNTVTTSDLLGHLHYLHLTQSPFSFSSAFSALRSINGYDLDDDLACLHIYLAYSRDPVTLLYTFPVFSTARFTRETLHLTILSRIRLLPRLKLEGMLELVHLFYPITPGTESWRHIAKYALAHNQEPLACIAWDSAMSQMARLSRGVASQRTKEILFTPSVSSSTSSSHTKASINSPSSSSLKPNFKHFGRKAARWDQLLEKFARKGWVEALDDNADKGEAVKDAKIKIRLDAENESVPGVVQRWGWRGVDGEIAARSKRQAERDENAAQAKDNALMAQSADSDAVSQSPLPAHSPPRLRSRPRDSSSTRT